MSMNQSTGSRVGLSRFVGDADAKHKSVKEGARKEPPAGIHNGPGAAAILAAGVGSLALGIFAFAGDASPTILHAFNFWKPTGPLSGVTTTAVLVWLIVWYGLARRWARRNVNLRRIDVAAFAMLISGLLLTFPPFMDLLQGK